MQYSTPTTLLFDLDDTLFDHQHSDHSGHDAVRNHYPCFSNVPLADFIHSAETIMDSAWVKVMSGAISVHEWRTDSFRQLFACYDGATALDRETCMEAAQLYRQTYKDSRQAMAGAAELLESLRAHVTIGVVTNHFTPEQVEKLALCKLDHLVDFMVCVDDANAPKPQPHMFELALEKAKAEPPDAVMVGDSWSSDVMGATALGIRAVWINRQGCPCPDPYLAREINALLPTADICRTLMEW